MTQNVFAGYDVISDTAANRPATPTVANGRLCVFVASDTGDISIWSPQVAKWRFLPLPENRFTDFSGLFPAGVTGATRLMLGFAAAGVAHPWLLTPKTTGRVRMTVYMELFSDTANSSPFFLVKYGTGTAPVNGAAETGTSLSGQQVQVVVPAANALVPVTFLGEITGLTLGTQVWFDLSLGMQGAGIGRAVSISVIIEEF